MTEETDPPPDCYCRERRDNPAFAAHCADLPPGYCGRCETCGQPGHLRAHPYLPTTSAWCDQHWAQLLQRPRWRLDVLVNVVFWLIALGALAWFLWRG